ncbi:unnamed protein product, partial [marine sediment metagenome]
KGLNTKACDQCKSCNLFDKASHPDFFSVQPEEEGKALKIAQIKSLTGKINTASQYNYYKVCLIHPAEVMNTSAANALLKSLEEPNSAKTLFLLVSNQFMFLRRAHKAMLTILNKDWQHRQKDLPYKSASVKLIFCNRSYGELLFSYGFNRPYFNYAVADKYFCCVF